MDALTRNTMESQAVARPAFEVVKLFLADGWGTSW